ncbi:MAG TPA: winged helix-turn-helix domain-containing protein [Nitrososphaeraceae archaeon]|nr:winged helix-turn-helix domain-containing protein [Nitrososphaeraceae archaeon]
MRAMVLKKTKIMYSVLLGPAQFREYLTVLTERNLLRYDSTMLTFKITEKV